MDCSLTKVLARDAIGSSSLSSPLAQKMLSDRASSLSSVKKLTKAISRTPLAPREEMLMKFLLSVPDQPLGCNKEKFNGEEDLSLIRCENTPPGTDLRPNNGCHWREGKPLEKGATPECSEMSSSPKTPTARGDYKTCENYPSICHIRRGLDDGKSSARSEDNSALKHSSKGSKNNSGHLRTTTAEDKRLSDGHPNSIQDVMKNVVVYVEVRTGEDNRSAGVRKVISQLGAKVNDKLLRDTTHVIFKDGLQSTYNKAKKWDIPLVSILWIEECKKQMKLMDPILFPISNIERYENPELYGKFKRIKSMQPDAEEGSRRNRSKTVKETDIGKTANVNSALVVPRKPKDKLGEILYEFQEKILSTPDDNGDCLPFDSKLLQRIRNSPFTPKSHKEQGKGTDFAAVSEQSEDLSTSFKLDSRESLKLNSTQKQPHSLDYRSLKETKSESDVLANATAGKRTTRRSSISTTTKKDPIKGGRRRTLYTVNEQTQETKEELNVNYANTSISAQKSVSNKSANTASAPSVSKNNRRRALLTPTLMEVIPAKSKTSTRTIDSYFSRESNRRKIILNPVETIGEIADSGTRETTDHCDVEQEPVQECEDFKNNNDSKESFTLLEEHASTLLFSSTKTPQNSKRRTLFDISMDIIDQRLQSINKSAKQNKMRRDSIDSEHSTTPTTHHRASSSLAESNLEEGLGERTLTEDVNKNERAPNPEVQDQLPKKRKLFAPIDVTSSPTTSALKDFDPLKTMTKKRTKKPDEGSNVNKKRRTLFGSAPPADSSSITPVPQAKPERRRTMGFDVIRRIATSHKGTKAELAVPFLV